MAAERGLVERDAAQRTLEEALDALTSGAGGLVLIEGAFGSGRTALLEYAGMRARLKGIERRPPGGTSHAPGVVLVDEDDPLSAGDVFAVHQADRPLLVIAVASGGRGDELRGAASCAAARVQVVVTAPLSDAGGDLVLHRLLPGSGVEERRVRHHDAGGLPYLLHALAPHPAAGDPPRDVVRHVVDRVEATGSDPVAVAGAFAVLGAEATLQRAVRVTGLPVDRVGAATQRLIEVGVLLDELPPVFAAPAFARAVLAGLPISARARLHLGAAECLRDDGLGPDSVAAHLLTTAAGGRSWVVAALRDAADHARRNGEPAAAVAFLRRALLEPPAAGDRATVLVDLASAESAVADPAATGRLEEALRLLPAGEQRVRVRFRLGRQLVYSGAVEQGLAVLGQALDEVGEGTSDLAYRIETAFIAGARVDTRSIHLARARLAHRREQPPKGDSATERGLLAELAYLEGLDGRRLTVARDLALRALGGPTLHHVSGLDPSARHLALIVLMWAGELDLVEQALHLVLQLGRQHGNRLEEVLAHELLAAVAQERGQVDGVIDAIAAIGRALGRGNLVTAPSHRARLAMAHLDRGSLTEAQALVDGFDAAVHPGSTLLHLFLVARARVRLAAGEPERALADALECGRGTAQLGNRNAGFPQWRAPAVEALVQLGRTGEARRLADEEVELARAWGLPRPIGVALAARAMTLPPASRAAALERAVDVLRSSPAVLELARALGALGEVLEVDGRFDEAERVTDEARSIATRSGASLSLRLAPDGAGGTRPRVELAMLDGFRLERDGEPVILRGVPATLVKVLAVTRRPIHVEQLADLLWDDGDPSSRTRVRNVLTRVRRAAGEIVVREGEALRLDAAVHVDSWSFADAAQDLLGLGGDRDEAWLDAARRALRLYRGDLLPEDPYAEWAERPRCSLARLHLELLEATAGALAAMGRAGEAAPLARRASEVADRLDR